MRVVIADDNLLVREGIASLLRRAGIEVAAEATCPDELHRAVDVHVPDVAIVDIRARHPRMAILILSQHVDLGTATRVLAESPERLGYLLKDRVTDVDDFTGTRSLSL